MRKCDDNMGNLGGHREGSGRKKKKERLVIMLDRDDYALLEKCFPDRRYASKSAFVAEAVGKALNEYKGCVKEKTVLKMELIDELRGHNAFWSYGDISDSEVTDRDIIIKTITLLDIKEIDTLFDIYPKSMIKKVWKEDLVVQGDYYYSLNILMAVMYFHITKPEKYINNIITRHLNRLCAQID